MAFSVETLASLNGFAKDIRAEKLEKLVPADFHLINDIPFNKRKKLGRNYLQPVFLTYPHGVTFSVADVVPNLNAVVTAITREASVTPFQIIARDRLSYDSADRAASAEEAFENETTFLMEALRLSHTSKAEALMFYGGHANGLGTVLSVATNVISVTVAEWAGGIWAGSENMRVDIYNAGTYVKTCQIASVDLDLKTLTVDNGTGVAGGHAIFYEGAFGNTQYGIHQIITNGSTLFGIDASAYSLWKGVTQAGGGTTASLLVFLQAGARARIKGMRGKVKTYLSAFAFADLVNQVEAAKHDSSGALKGSQIERGSDSMKIYSPNGNQEFVVSDFVKYGLAFGTIQDGSWTRIGSSDVTFRYPGTDKEEFFIHLQEAGGYEFRSWSNFSLFSSRPGANFVVNNLVNSAS